VQSTGAAVRSAAPGSSRLVQKCWLSRQSGNAKVCCTTVRTVQRIRVIIRLCGASTAVVWRKIHLKVMIRGLTWLNVLACLCKVPNVVNPSKVIVLDSWLRLSRCKSIGHELHAWPMKAAVACDFTTGWDKVYGRTSTRRMHQASAFCCAEEGEQRLTPGEHHGP